MSSGFAKFKFGRNAVRTDVVGLDVGGATTRVVRLKRVGDTINLVAADLLPRVELPSSESGDARPAPLLLPKPLRALYAAIVVTSPQAGIRLLSMPVGPDSRAYMDAVMATAAWREWYDAAMQETWIMQNNEPDWPLVRGV